MNPPEEIIHVRPPGMPPAPSDQACQDILADPNRWIGVAQKVRKDWERCLGELQVFEELLDQDRLKRIRWAKSFRIFGFCLTTVQNTIAGVAAIIPFLKTNIPDPVAYGFSIATFVLSLTLWTRLGERSNKYLVLASDNANLMQLCKTIRQKLKEIMKDGKISESERSMIRDMMGQMHQRSEEIGSMDLIMKIIGDNSTSNVNKVRIFGNDRSNKNYNDAFQGVSDIIDEIGRSHQEINSRIPYIIREYKDVQLQSQIHSAGHVTISQRLPHDVIR